MNVFRIVVLTAAFLLLPANAEARPAEVEQLWSAARKVGEARYQYLAWRIFDGELWNETGVFDWDEPFALVLTYRRSFSARALADRSLSEMSRRGFGDAATLAPLSAPLHACFADVAPGDRITGVSTGEHTAQFYVNGRRRCDIQWPRFRRAFFGIWLDASGGDRTLSDRLSGRG